jgi:3-oxoadipate CoA-transferase alpha subunit
MIDKRVDTIDAALSGIEDGSTILVSGFGNAGSPIRLLEALIDQGAANLTIVSNNAGEGEFGLAALMKAGRVTKVICSYPRSAGSIIFEELYDQGKIELEVVPQGTLSERMRAAGAGIGGFFTPTSAGTLLGANKETREIEGKLHVLETPLKGDVALVKADAGDRWGNLTYNKSARNFGPTMAMAAKLTIAEVKTIKDLGEISPEHVVTPGIFVDRVIKLREEQ